ncbi:MULTISPECIES: PepSY-associated TM helix domain-containing protein [unclassified Sphingobium]|uniref:PepSY-associated TM helix domain-containing protein n=1 Tax=unclassified Sphingobium TaxID=2611147 RepID=UPI0022259BAB|nr:MULTISPECIES: PepSY-associated TM helix domain-containing protein [unclassified Sphingobium]MCW2413367.1 putative iron-regulated membrane protein [Sphingobium sp. B8D3D]MCW2414334.1 putative iron-regulated membrane protein [Sphingobium sp. B8D3A]
MTTPNKRTAFWSPDLVRAVLKGHSGLGLAFAGLLYLVCLTGAIAVFANEFYRWENPGAEHMESISGDAVQRAYREAMARTKGAVEHVLILMPSEDRPWPTLRVDAEDGTRTTWIADSAGLITGELRESWTHFLTRLHINLHLPQSWGIFIVGLSGVALLSSLISGLLAHPRIFRDAFHLRLGGSRRLQEADLHNRIGVWALPFHLTVSLTGALLGLSTVIIGAIGLAVFQGDTAKVYAIFTPPQPAEDTRPAPPIDLRPLFTKLDQQAPGARISYLIVEHPTEQGAAAMFEVESGTSRIANGDVYAFNRAGALYYVQRAAQNNVGQQILGSLGPLHFGWFGGGIVKIAYALLGLGLTYLAVGGVNIWLARRRDKGKPAPGWERVWAATVWGQPMALIGAASTALFTPAAAALPIWTWAGVSLAALGAATTLSPPKLSRIGKAGSGALLICLAMGHSVLVGTDDSMALIVDATLGLIGLGLLAVSVHWHRGALAVKPLA